MTALHPSGILRATKAAQAAVEDLGLGSRSAPKEDVVSLYDKLVTDPDLRESTGALFGNGHYSQAIEEAFKCLNNTVKCRSNLSNTDGADLMRKAFSANQPVLKLSRLRSQSERDEQIGYMEIFAGCMTGIRNPRAHEHQYSDDPKVALELLSWANHLMSTVKRCIRSRRRRTKGTS